MSAVTIMNNDVKERSLQMKSLTHRRSIRGQSLILTLLLSAGLCLISGTLMAQEVVTTLMSNDLENFPARKF